MDKRNKHTVEERQKGADLIGGLILIILTILSIKGIKLYYKTPENHAIIFSLSILWLIHAIIHLLTFQKFRAKNPYKTKFANWEKEGNIYRYFGIKIFRKVIFYSPFVLMSLGIRVWSGRDDFERVLRELNMAEGSHKLALIFTSIIVIILFFVDHRKESFYLLIGIILFHVYPIMLQRWNRGRLMRLINNNENINNNVC
jgi:hypothetical protein